MNNTAKKIVDKFLFLQKLGYEIMKLQQNVVSYRKGRLILRISFDPISYEINCYFKLLLSKVEVSLFDIISYQAGVTHEGVYQVGDISQLDIGLDKIKEYMSYYAEDVLKGNFIYLRTVYKWEKKEEQNERIEAELKEAETYWKNGEWDKSLKIYKKHKKILSKLQLKRVEYIEKQDNK